LTLKDGTDNEVEYSYNYKQNTKYTVFNFPTQAVRHYSTEVTRVQLLDIVFIRDESTKNLYKFYTTIADKTRIRRSQIGIEN
jgi:hypothetical protein